MNALHQVTTNNGSMRAHRRRHVLLNGLAVDQLVLLEALHCSDADVSREKDGDQVEGGRTEVGEAVALVAWIEHHRTKKILEQLVVSLSALRAMLSVEGLRARCGSQGRMRCVEYMQTMRTAAASGPSSFSSSSGRISSSSS